MLGSSLSPYKNVYHTCIDFIYRSRVGSECKYRSFSAVMEFLRYTLQGVSLNVGIVVRCFGLSGKVFPLPPEEFRNFVSFKKIKE